MPPVGEKPPASPTPTPSPASAAAARGIGLAITNLTKLGGLWITVNETLVRTELRPVALGVAAFMMAGAQGLETFLDKMFGR